MGKKEYSFVAVVSNLTESQATRMSAEVMKAKGRCAPEGRGTIAMGKKENVGNMLQGSWKKIGKK